MEQLILFRGIQGLGAGAIFPISLAVIGDLFSPQERGKYQGLFGAVFGISALIGPALGGFLTDQVSWHWIFFVNIPIGAVALYIIWRLLPAHVTDRRHTQGRLRWACRLHVRARPDPDRPDQRAVPRLDGSVGRRTDRSGSPVIGVVFLFVESRAAGADRAARSVP